MITGKLKKLRNKEHKVAQALEVLEGALASRIVVDQSPTAISRAESLILNTSDCPYKSSGFPPKSVCHFGIPGHSEGGIIIWVGAIIATSSVVRNCPGGGIIIGGVKTN